MEIPFVVNARKDTGLFNSKVAIWLFLASEVTLFGGLFSGYLFLRLYADYPWPERTLPVLPGLINTAILIASSMTVVFAWAALKMRNWRSFQINMAITLLCAAAFMVLKSIEYKAKFAHQAVRLESADHPVLDFAILEGHLHKAEIGEDGKLHHAQKDDKGNYSDEAFYANKIIFEADEFVFPLSRHAYGGFVDTIIEQAQSQVVPVTGALKSFFDSLEKNKSKLGKKELKQFEAAQKKGSILSSNLKNLLEEIKESKISEVSDELMALSEYPITLAEDFKLYEIDEDGKRKELEKKNIPAGESLSKSAIAYAEKYFLKAKSEDAQLRTHYLKSAFAKRREAGDDRDGWQIAQSPEFLELQAENAKQIKKRSYSAPGTITFKAEKPLTLHLDPGYVITKDAKQLTLRDDTTIKGTMGDSSMFLAVDGIDFRFTAQRAEEKGIDPEAAIAKSWVLKQPELKKIWDSHQEWLRAHTEMLDAKSDKKGLKGEDRYVPTDNEKYRVNWDQIVAYQNYEHKGIYDRAKASINNEASEKCLEKPGWIAGFAGPNHKKMSFPEVTIPRENIGFESTFTPKWNTYYAIYFTITGLHGLHVIGGMIVLGYYLFFGRKMYESNPEWLANRVEVGGLFWHFVDLVWIFLFPILYLM